MQELHIRGKVELPETDPCMRDLLRAVAAGVGPCVKKAMDEAKSRAIDVATVSAKLVYDDKTETVHIVLTLEHV